MQVCCPGVCVVQVFLTRSVNNLDLPLIHPDAVSGVGSRTLEADLHVFQGMGAEAFEEIGLDLALVSDKIIGTLILSKGEDMASCKYRENGVFITDGTLGRMRGVLPFF